MTGAYTAKPATVASSSEIPVGWNPLWSFPGPLPPGYTPTYGLTFVAPPTPESVGLNEEITVRVSVYQEGAGAPPSELATILPDTNITWTAILDGNEIAASSKGWTKISGKYYSSWTFTPPLDGDDITEPPKVMTVTAEGIMNNGNVSSPLSENEGIDVEETYGYDETVGYSAGAYTGHDQWAHTGQLTLTIKDSDNNTECQCVWAHSDTYDPVNFPGDQYETGPTVSQGSLPGYVSVARSGNNYVISIPQGSLDPAKSYQWIFTHTAATNFSGEPTPVCSATATLTKSGSTESSAVAGSGSSGVTDLGGDSWSVIAGLTLRIADSTEPLFEVLQSIFPSGRYDDVVIS